MTASAQELRALKEAINANKRQMEMLDDRIEELETIHKLSRLEEPWGNLGDDAGSHPYWYGVRDSRGEVGIRLGNQTDTPPFLPLKGLESPLPFTGTIEIQEDAPFVWTHIAATLRMVPRFALGNALPPDQGPELFVNPFMTLQNGVVGDQTSPLVQLGLTEQASGRVLYQSELSDGDASSQIPNRKNQLLPPAMFDTMRVYIENGGFRATTAGMSAAAPGHGPNEAVELPSEVLLPANGVIEVKGQASLFENALRNGIGPDFIYASFLPQLYVALVGYKIYGD